MLKKPNFDEASKIAGINQRLHEHRLPVLANIRDEEQHILALINGIVDKALDLAKLLIGISFPALITLYSLKSEEFNTKNYLILTFGLLIVGVLIFYTGMRYKLSKLPQYMESSFARLKSYTEMQITASLNAQNEDKKLEFEKNTKKQARP